MPPPTVDTRRIKVLYIAGSGRSGSTILCQLLGEFDGFFCAGELSNFWDRYLDENSLCACGVEFHSCEVWSRVTQQGMPGMNTAEARSVARLYMRIGRTQQLPFLVLPALREFVQQPLTEYTAHLAKLYRAIQVETGCTVIVDSSKFPSYGWILSRTSGIEMFVLHLVRDPRAVAYSWARRRPPVQVGIRTEIPRFGPVSSSLRWLTRNALAERLWRSDPRRYLLLRYEDFVANPQATVSHILQFIGEGPASAPFVGKHQIHLGENHIVLGNRTRFLRGVVDIQLDSEWQTQIKNVPRIIVEWLTWPWMRKYRYAIPPSLRPDAEQPGDRG